MNNNFNFLKSLFELNNFPENECIIQDKREPDVFYSNNWYTCLLFDSRFNNGVEIKILRPYIAHDRYNDNNGKVYYGWFDEYGNVYDDSRRPIHEDDLRVIGYRNIG